MKIFTAYLAGIATVWAALAIWHSLPPFLPEDPAWEHGDEA